MRQAQYLHRPTARMFRRQFPPEEPVCGNAIDARKAVDDLLRSIAVKPPRNSYGWRVRFTRGFLGRPNARAVVASCSMP